MNIVYRKTGFHASFQDFLCTNINNHLFCFEKKTITTYLKAKNFLHATRISSFKYVFIFFFETKQMLKYTLIHLEIVKRLKKCNYIVEFLFKTKRCCTHPPPHNFILFELDFDVKFPLSRLLLFLSDFNQFLYSLNKI